MKKYAWLILVVFLAGCFRGSYTSLKDPGYTGKQFGTVLVFANGMDLTGQKTTETYMQKQFRAYGVTSFKSIDLLPPTNNYTLEETIKVLRDNNIDSVLILTLSGTDISTAYVPQFGGSTTTGTINTFGNTSYFNSRTQGGGGGFYVSKPIAYYKGALYDTENFKTAWISSGDVQGNAFANFIELSVRAGGLTVKKLITDGLYQRGEPMRQ